MSALALRRARRGAVLGLLAALLLANPLYVGLFVDAPRTRDPTGYVATPVDPSNASDQQTIIRRLGDEEILDVGTLRAAASDSQETRYRAPGRALSVLRQARENGTARTSHETASFTLHRVIASHRYVTFPHDDPGQYYRVAIEERNGAAVVTARPVDRATVARFLVYRDSRLYASLPTYQRETVDKVLAAEYSYRPYNEEFEQLTDNLLIKDGTYYLFSTGIHADDFGISTRDLVSFGLSVLGALAFLAALGFTLLAARTDGSDGDE